MSDSLQKEKLCVQIIKSTQKRIRNQEVSLPKELTQVLLPVSNGVRSILVSCPRQCQLCQEEEGQSSESQTSKKPEL